MTIKPNPKESISDALPFEHGQEGTHYACLDMVEKSIDGNVECCGCSRHKCKQESLSGVDTAESSVRVEELRKKIEKVMRYDNLLYKPGIDEIEDLVSQAVEATEAEVIAKIQKKKRRHTELLNQAKKEKDIKKQINQGAKKTLLNQLLNEINPPLSPTGGDTSQDHLSPVVPTAKLHQEKANKELQPNSPQDSSDFKAGQLQILKDLLEEVRNKKGYLKNEDGAYVDEYERGINTTISLINQKIKNLEGK